MTDADYMARALELAQGGCGWVSPNPMVGAVVVRDGRIIGEGFHARCGDLHAERVALSACREDPRGATLYVTLEPCCHHGRTPPCTEAILSAGIERVVIGSPDPNPLVDGGGTRVLRAAGLVVTEGVLRPACDALNQIFFHYIRHKTPYVLLKYAMTLDGKLATASGASRWITGAAARARVHEDRHRYRAIMVGVGTVLTDDPLLTCRSPGGRNPLRILCDSTLRTPLRAQVVQTASEVPTLFATCCTDDTRMAPYRAAGCEVLTLPPGPDGRLDLNALMQALGQRELDSVLLEGGAALHWSALQAGMVRRVHCYLAPKLFGGTAAKSPVGGLGVDSPDQAIRLSPPAITVLGDDLLLDCEVLPPCSPVS